MISSLFYYYIFKDICDKIPDKYFLNTKPNKQELYVINAYYYNEYYNLFSSKKDLDIFKNFNINIKYNINYYIHLIKDNNYNKEGIILLYAYITYLVLNKHKENLVNLENYYFLTNKINKKIELKNTSYFYYDFLKPYYVFLDLVARHILKYPDITSYLKKASINCHKFNRLFLSKETKFKNLLLKILSKKTKKNYLNKDMKFQIFDEEYNQIIEETTKIISLVNDSLYYDKSKPLDFYLDTYFI